MARALKTKPKPNLVDKVVSYFNPGLGLKRIFQRQMLDSYTATKPSRFKRDRETRGGSGDDHLNQLTLWELREIGRELEEEQDPTAEIEAIHFKPRVAKLGIKKASFLNTNNDFGIGSAQEFAKMLKANGLNTVARNGKVLIVRAQKDCGPVPPGGTMDGDCNLGVAPPPPGYGQ